MSTVSESVDRPTPVVLVPGTTGTELRDPESGAVLWGTGPRLLTPRDGGYAIALPLGPGGPPPLAVGPLIRSIHLAGVIRRPIYQPIFDLLTGAGYRLGDLDRPDPHATFFPFHYDWRRDDLEVAGLLRERLERLRQVRGEERLRVSLVCQSNGAHICRYLVKYGGASLAAAEAGEAGPPDTLAVERVVLVGASNGGSLRILRMLDRGRHYIAAVGRTFRPEVLFTFASLYQDLPAYRDDLFLDSQGQPLDVDLFDPQSWRTYGWSVFSPAVRSHLERYPRPDLFSDEAGRFAFLTSVLDRSRRLHRLLARDVPRFGPTRYYEIRNLEHRTPERAVLERRPGSRQWRTWITPDRRLRRLGLEEACTASGDGHATVTSQQTLSPQEEAALGEKILTTRGGDHFSLILEPEARRYLLQALGGE